LVSDGSGKIAASATTTTTEIGYLAGVTSAIQTQLNSKLNLTGGTLTGGLIGTTGSFSSSGSGDTFTIGHTSGSGIALNITKNGNGEGLYINKASGSGNAATIIGTLNATTLVKSGGTASQFLMADGSVNTSVLASGAYLPLAGGTLTGALSGTSATFSGDLTIDTNTLFVDSANNSVGIGTLIPKFQSFNRELTVSGGTTGTSRAAINIQGSRTTNSTFGSFAFYHQTNYVAGIESSRAGADNSGNLQFFTTNAGITGERLTIDSTGAATFSSSISTGSLSLSGSTMQSSGDYYIGTNNANFIQFYTSNQNRMIITSGGNVGIGTSSSPTFKLQVAGNCRIQDTLSLENGDSGQAIFTNNSTAVSVSTTTALGGSFSMGGNGAFVIVYGASGGNIFIDTIISANSGTPIVLSSTTVSGSPSARTYSTGSNRLQLSMASGTYDVRINIFRQT
jgi:hypothetical protein